MSSFLLAREDRPTWWITTIAAFAFIGVLAKCFVALSGGAGIAESGGGWALLTLVLAGSWHYERRVSNELRHWVRR